MMPMTIYSLCALTSILCAGLLIRDYRRVRLKLLMWLSLCFIGLALNNVLLVVDLITPGIDLSLLRSASALAGLVVLLVGLAWEAP